MKVMRCLILLRSLINGCGNSNHDVKKQKLASELEYFDEIFPELVGFLISSGLNDPERKDASNWFKEVIHWNQFRC